MAPRKQATKKPGTAVAKWDEELAKLAELSTGIEASVGTGGQYIKTRGGQLEYNGGIIPNATMNVIILDHVLENAYYSGRYDPDNPAPPSCFALGRDDKDMAPHEESESPEHDACAGCPMNQFGSADTGRGKACKNIRRLALLPEDALEDIGAAEPAYLKVPVTSIKEWAGYIRQLNDTLKRPPLGVITEISLKPHAQHQFHMHFKLIGTIDDGDLIGELLEKRKTVNDALMTPYKPAEEQPATPARGKGRNAPPARGSKVAARTQPTKPAARGRR